MQGYQSTEVKLKEHFLRSYTHSLRPRIITHWRYREKISQTDIVNIIHHLSDGPLFNIYDIRGRICDNQEVYSPFLKQPLTVGVNIAQCYFRSNIVSAF